MISIRATSPPGSRCRRISAQGRPPGAITAPGRPAVGLVLFFVGAVLAHLRARVPHTLAFPLVFLLLAGVPVGYFE
ncbi:DoxX family protein [Kitasatospora sp. CB01950]|uniref:DoxX family protein n=1 Tax=Kitasatospora sp. CB01950 TaxID=1703930 RepID=UPI000960F6C8|nr:hypothetical protein AMK19_08920 [Kitasatospora sp. CB01950]